MTVAGRYEVREVLVEDELRVVVRAKDLKLGRDVLLERAGSAVRQLARRTSKESLREGQALAGVQHPGVQRLHDVLEGEGGVTLVLEPVAGETLAERLARKHKLEPDEVLRLGLELADALAAVHAASVVHRDLQPENVVLRPDGSACLVGFRLAKPTSLDAQTSLVYRAATDGPLGSVERRLLPCYPAPEQMADEAANPRTDLFSLGCLLYRALTGEEAIPDLLATDWLPPTDPAKLVPEAPARLCETIHACLSRSPVGRPSSAGDVRDGLRATERAAPQERRRAPWLVALGVIGVAALAFGAYFARGDSEAANRSLDLTQGRDVEEVESGAFSSSFERSVALLIAVEQEYGKNRFPVLSNAVRDVEALADVLRDMPGDWDVRVLPEEKATYNGIRAALSDLENELQPNDRAFVYFAGHGKKNSSSEKDGWILPADAKRLEDDPRRLNWISFSELTRFLEVAPAKHVLLAADCCYSGRLAVARSAASEFNRSYVAREARLVLTSGRADEVVSDGPAGEHSPFAQILIDVLGDDEGPMTSGILYAELLRRYPQFGVSHAPAIRSPRGFEQGEFVFVTE